ncbi:MAG: glycosyltransferase family 2 protein [Opitutus sp.]|nr:glycosyltransferase family 2 protein [Opitutus sp.]MCS6246767.1 glycosyltransferase family 2 protein [Opitutus sp.]MCS6273271.1 glycosyltransferase family 2 protein [Opitutus sp.]MCS6276191.1 glycosyltransferase family 2 protein [Opitutus sp.]MCS6301285.1 glycosyltransferase family 2 protein [Opitutus sp.]
MSDPQTPSPSATLPLLCVVIPVFNEEPVVPELLERLQRVLGSLTTVRWEVVFVDDGSRDRTASMLAAAAVLEPRFQLVRLSRNFGHQPALTAGLAQAGLADAVVTMDADLQDPPELIPELVKAWQAGAEVVLAVRRSRQDAGLRRVGFDVFHRWFQRVSDFKIEANTGTFGLLARPAVAAINALEEHHRFFPGLRAWVGFKQAEVIYDRQERAAGTPGQTLRRLVRYALDGIFSFSYFPLRMMTYTGMFIAGLGFAVGAFFVMRRLLGQEVAFTGFTTLVTLILFLGGVQLIGIGILGEYLGRIYDEAKRRPLYVLRPPAES